MKYLDLMYRNLIYTFFLTVILTAQIVGQAKIISPYSAIGLGDITSRDMYHSKMMGGLGAAFNSPDLVNTVNPAALGFLKMTAFDVGTDFGYHELREGDNRKESFVGGLQYLSLAFPLRNPITEVLERKNTEVGWGMGISLMPYTKVGYNFSKASFTEDSINIRKNVVGRGGLYKLMFSNGWRYKNTAVGLNLGYLFGNIEKTRELFFINLDNPYNEYFSDKVSMSAFVWDVGVMHKLILNKKEKNSKKIKSISLGIYANSEHKFNSSVDQFYWAERKNYALTSSQRRDTFVFETNSIKGVLPANVGIGAYFYDAVHHTIGINAEWMGWSAFRHEILARSDNYQLVDGLKLSLGGSYTKEMSSYNFTQRIIYRYGFYWMNDPRQLGDRQIQDVGITLGTTMPLYYTRQISQLHLGIKMGRVGLKDLLTDNYIEFKLGVTFNDNKWFMQRKFN